MRTRGWKVSKNLKLISRLKNRLNEDDKWMQKADADIEKRGTEGVFHKWCVDRGYKDGCSKGLLG